MHGCMVYTERAETAVVSCGTNNWKYTPLVDIQKCAIKTNDIHSCRITCERSESAREGEDCAI